MTEPREQQARAVRWLYSEAGQAYLRCEQKMLDRALSSFCGVHLLQLSILDNINLVSQNQISHSFSMAPYPVPDSGHAALASFDSLPLEQHSLDCVVLHHVLEFALDPHAILREAARVIRPEGQLVIVSFNPWSVFFAQQLFSRHFKRRSWHMQALSTAKLSDWLRLLDFAIASTDYCWHLPKLDSGVSARRLEKYQSPLAGITRPFGAGALLAAKKRHSTLTPVRKRWADLSHGLAVPIIKPSTRAAMQADDEQ